MRANCSSTRRRIWKREVNQRRWVRCIFSHNRSCGVTPAAASVCLQLWINRLEAREPSLVEGDTHSCGAANIAAGSYRGEGAKRNQASHPADLSLWCLTGASRRSWLCLPSEGNPNHHSSFSRKSEVRFPWSWGGPQVQTVRDDVDIYPEHVPFTHNWSKLTGQDLYTRLAAILSLTSRDSRWSRKKSIKWCQAEQI